MGKYEGLAEYLKSRIADEWDASFGEIEEILNFELPPSARKHPSWWGNASSGNHSQAKGWMEAGWTTDPQEIDLSNERVRFVRSRKAGRRQSGQSLERLRKDAMKISGIGDPDALERAALTALIQREAGRMLIDLGGTMPDFTVPERERPTW